MQQLLLLRPFNDLFSRTTWASQYQKGITNLDLNEARDDGALGWQLQQLDQTICTSLQTANHTNTSSLNFYRPDGLPDAQPTVSKHSLVHEIHEVTSMQQRTFLGIFSVSHTSVWLAIIRTCL